MADADLTRRLDELARRLERIERHLNLRAEAAGPGPAPEPEATPLASHLVQRRREAASGEAAEAGAPEERIPQSPIAPTPPPAQPSRPPVAPPVVQTAKAAAADVHESKARLVEATTSPLVAAALTKPRQSTAPIPSPTPAPSRADDHSARGIEAFLGIKGAAWLGAIGVVVGTALAIREYATGFWATLPTWGQALIIAFGGAALIGLGEVAMRKVGRAASVGLIGGGLGVLYLDAYATFRWFDPAVVSEQGSFILMALVAAVGFALTWRTRSLAIGVLSLIGGYLTPILLAGGDGGLLLAATYLTMLLGVALALSITRPRPFRSLRYVALGGQLLLGIMLVDAAGPATWPIVLVFLSIWWAMIAAESVLAALRRQSAAGNVVAVLLATLGYVWLGGWTMTSGGPAAADWLGPFLLAVAVFAAAIALHFGPGIEGLRGQLISPMDKLAVALWCAAGALLIAAIGFQFEGFGMAVGWLAVGLAAIEMGRRLPSRGVTVFGMIVGGLAIARIMLVDQFFGPLDTVIASGAWYTITEWSILALAGIAAVFIAAWRFMPAPPERAAWNAWPIVLATGGVLLFFALCALQLTTMNAVTGGWLACAFALLALNRLGARQRCFEIGAIALFITAGKWLMVDALAARIDPAWDALAHTPLLNAQALLALLIAAGAWWVFIILRGRMRAIETTRPIEMPVLWQFVLLIGAAILLIGFSFEIDRMIVRAATGANWTLGHVRNVLLTMLWTFGAAGIGLAARLAIFGSPDRFRMPRLLIGAAWTALAVLAGKWILVDTLYWGAFADSRATIAVLLNIQILAGLLIAGAAVLLVTMGAVPRLTSSDGTEDEDLSMAGWLRAATPVFAGFMVLWGLTFEVDRWLMQRVAAGESIHWPLMQWRALWWTGLWAVGGGAMMAVGRWRAIPSLLTAGFWLIVACAVAWLTYDTAAWRITEPPVAANVVLNLQFIIGALLIGLLIVSWRLPRDTTHSPGDRAFWNDIAPGITFGLIALIGLWLGSIEIDRAYANAPMARQMGWSVYWSLYGVGLVLSGFYRPSNAVRYAGLALLALTVGKVVIVDLSQAEQHWRIISFIASGLLLLGTSVAYARFAPRLLAPDKSTRQHVNTSTAGKPVTHFSAPQER